MFVDSIPYFVLFGYTSSYIFCKCAISFIAIVIFSRQGFLICMMITSEFFPFKYITKRSPCKTWRTQNYRQNSRFVRYYN